MQSDSQTEKYIRNKNSKKAWIEFIVAIFSAFLVVFIINRCFFFYLHLVDNSMENTLLRGSKVYFKRLQVPFFKKIKDADVYRGQIVALSLEDNKKDSVQGLSSTFFSKLVNVVFSKNHSQVIVRRIVGISGDTVEIAKKKLFVNQREVVPSWNIKKEDKSIINSVLSDRDNRRKILVPKGFLFVLSDNWDVFSDSRTLGVFPLDSILGKTYHK